MTLDLDRIEQAAREATPGPWDVADPETYNGTITAIHAPTGHESTVAFAVPTQGGEFARIDISRADARHIATSDPSTVLALVARVRELEDSVRTVLQESDRLTKAINEMPEWERAVKEAVKVEEGRIQALEAGLREACELVDDYSEKFRSREDSDRLAALRRLANPPPDPTRSA